MKVAALPFNAAEGTAPALGRQFSNFACDTIRAAVQADINPVSFLAQIESEDGPRAAFVNVADTLLDAEWIGKMFEDSDVEVVMDGLLKRSGDDFDLTFRFHRRGGEGPYRVEEWKFPKAEVMSRLHGLVKILAEEAQVQLPEALAGDKLDFGTDDTDAFLEFLEGYDAISYIQQAQGRVALEFQPKVAMDSLLSALNRDPDFVAPYEMIVQLARLCGQFRLGTFDDAMAALKTAAEKVPDDFKAHFAMGELYSSIGDHANSSSAFERAMQLNDSEPAILARLGLEQLQLGMPVNAERNFRRAVELEGDEKPSLDLLAMVLSQTNRAHEVPPLWKAEADKQPQNGAIRTKYAISLINAGRTEEGVKAFEDAIAELEDPLPAKRFYAPYLANNDQVDRALDYYEDCIEFAPNDVQLLQEYANALKIANRLVDIPKVLRDILASNPDPNTRATTLAWLIELEQPKRAQAIEQAKDSMQGGQFDTALQTVRPLKNWLSDYWPMWAVLSSAANQVGQHSEAEDAARRLIELFPGCEPAYGELNTALHGQGKDEEAYNIMRFAASNMPQSLGVHINLALAAKRFGRRDEAIQLAKQIREAVGPNQELDAVLQEIER